MPRIAVISDVHANLEALEAVLRDAQADEVWCLGDIVGYGASPNEVVDLLRGAGAKSVKGNHDDGSVTGELALFNRRAALAIAWTKKHLRDENLEFLRTLPLELRLKVGGRSVFLAHGSPDDPLWEYVDPRTHEDVMGHYFSKTSSDLVGLGHTHVPFVWRGEGTVFNPGSVGQPRDGDPRAAYAILGDNGGKVEVELRRVHYDVKGAAARILEAGLPSELAERLYVGV